MEERMRVPNKMLEIVNDDPNLLAALKADPIAEMPKLMAKAEREAAVYTKDKLIYRIAVIVLGSLAIIAAVGSIILVAMGLTTPEALVSLGSAAVGALVGLFAQPPQGSKE